MRLVVIAFTCGLVLAACGKTGGSSNVAGIYHLATAGEATSLALHDDGTYTLRRDSCESIGELECGTWKADAAGAAHVLRRDGMYWPTPEHFPSTVFKSLQLQEREGELVVVGESPWAGSFTQHWARGRSCELCGDGRGEQQRPCNDPLPVCASGPATP